MISLLRRLLELPLNLIRALFSSPGRIFSTGQRVFGISLPARVAALVAIFLVICVGISLLAFSYAENRSFWASLIEKPYHVFVIAILVVVIPIVVYHVLRLWLEGAASPFDDIDQAWKAGLAELERHGLDLSQVPVFLILGSPGPAQEKAFFDASRLSLNLREVPQGPAALHWYANPDGVFLVASVAGCLSRLAHVGTRALEDEKLRSRPAAARPGADAIRGTIVAGREDLPRDSITTSGPMPGAPLRPDAGLPTDIRGTMMVSDRSMTPRDGADVDAPGYTAEKRPITLPPEDASQQDRRLEYVCHLLHRVRQPLCPINGILTLLPYGLIQRGPREAVELQQTLKRDVATVRRVLKLRCPATALVVGLEDESGFQELVRRVGRDRAAIQRFGKGFALANPPLPERLEALCAHACGSFEDWVYTLFREKGSLSKPGNTRLYALLCKIRGAVQTRLTNILVSGFGSDPDQDPRAEPLLFGGCYFAALGETEDRQAFVKGVFDKLPQEQGELQWTDQARGEDQKYHQIAQLIFGLDFMLLVALVGMIGYRIFWR